ncbi:hypothetical protein [Treponema phagedenis]|uniref:hypothetical protein n=1 Tax=Treponema phagedenis TaxID=162 RepID=UPI0004654DA2|nr:hypothetical protein [Treponema phagedenis]NVP22713.1 hypothetical protein [Treponema phagedenis]NVP23238.1 hypothetical protein [Treponema phagedenis]QEK06200.1 hypothetical protein FUT80_05425 [Treponema phagedenis]QKS92567.1 hypothetical protein HPJ96_08420 [Treponema phagedenis]QLC57621.1 hypothetical protein HW453_01405 [Treponema phagedenis]
MEIITKQSIRDKNKADKQQIKAHYSVPGKPEGEMTFMHTGEGAKKFFTQAMFDGLRAAEGEMMAEESIRAFVRQTVLDITSAAAENPALFTEIYDVITNPAFSEMVEVRDLIGLQAAFGIVSDGESVPLAGFKVGKMEAVRLLTYALGYSISKDWVAYNKLWKIEQANKAIGVAYTAVLDHMHLSPIIEGKYEKEAVTEKVAGSTDLETVWLTLRKGLKDALKRKAKSGYRLRPSIALCNTATAMDVEAAISGLLQKGTQLGTLGQIQKVLAYDGWDGEVNGRVYNFPAPKDGEVFLIEPRKSFKALVKTDLTKLEQKGDIMRLSEVDVAAFFRRAVVADISGSVQKVTIA